MTDANTRPEDYLTKPLETWGVRELIAVVGTPAAARALNTTTSNVRMIRSRGRTTVERMQALQDLIRADERHYRRAATTMAATGAFRAGHRKGL